MNHNRIESDAYLARHARRSATNEASLLWMLAWGVLSAASFPIRWKFATIAVSIPQAVLICFVLGGLMGAFWYVRAKRDIDAARDLQNKRRIETEAKMRHEHMEKLRSGLRDR